jgi:hypothetical protein
VTLHDTGGNGAAGLAAWETALAVDERLCDDEVVIGTALVNRSRALDGVRVVVLAPGRR